MSLTNFDNVKAAEIQPLIDQIWKEPATSKSYGVRAHTIRAILEHQTATLSLLETADKKNDVSVKWVDFCGDTSTDAEEEDDCTNDVCGEGAAKEQSYALNTFIKDCYSVESEELESSVIDYDTIVATGLAAKIKNIMEKFNNKAVAVIAANKGVNPYPGPYSYDGTTKDTSIDSENYGGETLIPYLMQVTEMNKGVSPYILDGGNLFQDYYIATKDSDETAKNMWGDLDFRYDMLGFAANSISDYTFLIDQGAIAIANRAKYPTLAQIANMKDGGWIHMATGNMMRYSIPVNIPEFMPMMFVRNGALVKDTLYIDVQHSVICNTDGKLVPTWLLKLRAGIYVNPIRCATGNTGIEAFKKVTS